VVTVSFPALALSFARLNCERFVIWIMVASPPASVVDGFGAA
jgi:hypothetical protein